MSTHLTPVIISNFKIWFANGSYQFHGSSRGLFRNCSGRWDGAPSIYTRFQETHATALHLKLSRLFACCAIIGGPLSLGWSFFFFKHSPHYLLELPGTTRPTAQRRWTSVSSGEPPFSKLGWLYVLQKCELSFEKLNGVSEPRLDYRVHEGYIVQRQWNGKSGFDSKIRV